MNKMKLYFLTFLLGLGFFITMDSSIAYSQGDSEKIKKCKAIDTKLLGCSKDLKEINEQSSKNNADLESIGLQLSQIQEKVKTCYSINAELIDDDKVLSDLYKECNDLLDRNKKNLSALGSKNEEIKTKNQLSNKLNGFFVDYKKMVASGKSFCSDEKRESLDSLKKEAIKLDEKINAEIAPNKKLCDEDPSLNALNDSIKGSQKAIENMKIEPKNDIFGYVWKGAIVLASIFIVFNMINSNIKSKKMMKNIGNNKNEIPKI